MLQNEDQILVFKENDNKVMIQHVSRSQKIGGSVISKYAQCLKCCEWDVLHNSLKCYGPQNCTQEHSTLGADFLYIEQI